MTRVLLLILCFLAAPLWAVEPDEVLQDPVLEARARELSKQLRCLVCQNENIDSSNAGIAKDLRLLVRERLMEDETDEEVLDFIVDRYGEFVLLKPRLNRANLVLWLLGPALLLLGLLVVVLFVRARAQPVKVTALDEDEQKRLDELLKR